MFDLDGDGIETTSTRDGTVILFDHDADGIKTGTGWVKPNDGWLVLDRNSNGKIDSGRELFGVDTIKANGQFATDGFDALKDFDLNADGVVNALDSVFSNLKIWQDLNQDGVTQANELTTLSALNITSIGVASTAVRNDLGNGNVQTAAGTFTRGDGTVGASGETNGTAANLDLLVNTFYREYSDHIGLTAQAKTLPTLHGSGRVRDLGEAISQSTDLGNWMATYIAQTTRQGQIANLDGLMQRWADTSDLKSLKSQAAALTSSGVTLTYALAGLTPGSAPYNDFVNKLGIVERFMGFTYGGSSGEARLTPLDASSGHLTVALSSNQQAQISLAYDRFKSDIYESLLPSTRLISYTKLLAEDCQLAGSFTPLENAFTQAIATNATNGLTDLIEFVSAVGEARLARIGWAVTAFIGRQVTSALSLGALSEELSSWTVKFASLTEHNLIGASRPDLMIAANGDDRVEGNDGDDILFGRGGNDIIAGGQGDDLIDGGTGNDVLAGGAYDTWNVNFDGAGNDIYQFGRGDGQDRVVDYDITAGNSDRLYFKAGISPSAVLTSRDGDTLVLKISGTTDELRMDNYFGSDATNGWQIEEIRFTDSASTVWDVATVKAKVLVGSAGDDTIIGYSTADTINGNDGNDTVYAGLGNDIVNGGNGNDSLIGEGGNDTLSGGAGNDVLQGSAGNDTLSGGTGNDVLAGGVYDTWNGNFDGAGSDTYQFGRGDGQDRIYDFDNTAGVVDKILFKTGVSVASVLTSRDGDALVLKISGTTDELRVENYFVNEGAGGWQIEEIRFTDSASTVWNVATVKAKVLVGSAGNDVITGYATADTISAGDGADAVVAMAGNDIVSGGNGNDFLDGGDGNDTLNGDNDDDTLVGGAGLDVLNGGAGNDLLQGSSGNDTLNGGTGNDVLAGGVYDTWNGNFDGAGADTYQFGIGDGQDRIYDLDSTAGVVDKIVFKTGVAVASVVTSRDGDALVLKISGTTDELRVENYFVNEGTSGWQIEEIRFTDSASTVWNVATVKAKVLSGSAADDTIIGYATADTINGNDGNDTVYAGAGNDIVNGGNGNDNLVGESGDDVLNGNMGDDVLQGSVGNDTLNGSVGNDVLAGGVFDTWNGNFDGAGSDTYQFGIGDGQDRIYDFDSTAGVVDKIVFKTGVAVASVVTSRDGDALVLKISGTTDELRVENYFVNEGTSGWQIEEIRFTDSASTVWNVATVKAKVLSGSAADDTIIGYATADTINGNDGNDTVYAGAGNDIVSGGNGNDILIGEAGDDTLSGGAGDDLLHGSVGNDTLNGGGGNDVLAGGVFDTWNGNYDGAGSDTYQFGVGDGQDRIYDFDNTAGVVDKIVFKTGVAVSSVLPTRDGDALVLKISGTTDELRVENYFVNEGAGGWQIEEIRFTDSASTVWNVATIKAKVLFGTAGNDTITGYATADTINAGDGIDAVSAMSGNDIVSGGNGNDSLDGGDGNDTLNGDNDDDTLAGGAGIDILNGGTGNDVLQGSLGNDTLNGGAGNDVMAGGVFDTWNGNYDGAGSDTYQFGRGDGQDHIYDFDNTAGVVDKIVFKTGVAVASVLTTRDGDALVLKISGTTDELRVENYFVNEATGGWQIEEIRFTDSASTVWNVATVKAKVAGGATGSVPLAHTTNRAAVSELPESNDVVSRWSHEITFERTSLVGSSAIEGFRKHLGYDGEQFTTSDGATLLDSKLQGLLDAMASFTPPALGQSAAPPTHQLVFMPVIATDSLARERTLAVER